jgi:hypothetical protein
VVTLTGAREDPALTEPFARVEIEGDTGRGVVRREHAVALAAGHFPGDLFLPGAYLAELMVALAERVVAPARVRTIVRCALARRVRPDTEIVVTARASGSLVEVQLEAGGEPAAHATLQFV